MLKQLAFAFNYAVRSMVRDRRRTIFALISIAAGVAAVVALRALGLMITDALTANAQATLRGDVWAGRRGGLQVSLLGGGQTDHPFDSTNIGAIRNWATSKGYEIQFALGTEIMQIATVHTANGEQRAGAPGFVVAHFIDPEIYPFYDTLRSEEPSRVPLADLFDGPNQIVIGRRIADQVDIKVGDTVRIGTAKALHTVKGIMPDAAESSLTDPNSIFFSFIYLDRASLRDFGLEQNAANEAYLKLPPGTSQQAVVEAIRREWPARQSGNSFYRPWSTDTADRVLERNTIIADALSRFVLLLSLVGLVIGGVGIINTMLVSVNRRSAEIAVLKTLGLKGRGVSLVFLIEALISGVLGSLLGAGLGILLSLLARNFGEQAFGFALPWRVYFDPIVIGLVLGVTITLFFAFLPTLMAGQVRPILVLRQGNIPLARAGAFSSLLSLALLIVGMGVLVDLIIGTSRFRGLRTPLGISPGILGSFVVFLLLGIIIGLMWIVVWVLGKLPAFRNPNLRIAIRGLTMHRMRTALSLLALIIGMTALSGTLIMSRSINTLLYTSVSEPLGGNVIVLPLLPVQALVHGQLDQATGVNGYRDVKFIGGRLESIDGSTNFRRQLTAGDDARSELLLARLDLLIGVQVYGNPPRGKLVAGRYLGPEDSGKPHIVVPYEPELEQMGVKVGSKFNYRVTSGSGRSSQSNNVAFEVVGLVAPDERTGLIPFSLSDSAVQAPIDAVQSQVPFTMIIADVEPDAVNDAMARVGTVLGTFVFDISIFDSIINRLLTQMAALPLLIAVLSLFAAAALIATTVSLATMERRRQIGVLKAVGVNRRQALTQLLIENGIIGVVGGVVSLLPTLLILGAVPALTEGLVVLPVPVDLIVLMMVAAVGITLTATMVTAWSAASEKPLSVLRYE